MSLRWGWYPIAAVACISHGILSQGEGRQDEPGNLFGASLAAVGDVDSDGVCDFVVGSPKANSGATTVGRAWLVSTRKGQALFGVTDDLPGSFFGDAVASPGDLNGDGTPDFMVGARGQAGAYTVRSFSGKDGALLHSISLPNTKNARSFDLSFCGVGDLDGDHAADFVLTPVFHDDVVVEGSRDLQFRSGRTGSVLRAVTVRTGAPNVDLILRGVTVRREERFEASVLEAVLLRAAPDEGGASEERVVAAGDLDSDGVTDLLVSRVTGFGDRSRVIAASGKSGAVIREWIQRGNWSFGTAVTVLGDVNGDGTSDLIVTAPGTVSQVSYAYVLSGAEDRVLQEHRTEPWKSSNFGASVCAVGDVDGDGVPDYLIGEASWRASGDSPGFVRLYSGRSGSEITCWGQEDIRGGR